MGTGIRRTPSEEETKDAAEQRASPIKLALDLPTCERNRPARTALRDQAVPKRCRLRARSWVDGQGMPSRVRASAMEEMP
jgi:hypothetical protein